MRKLPFLALAAFALPGQAPAPAPRTPGEIIQGAPDGAWKAIADDDLLVMTVAGGRQVMIQLERNFAPDHIANIKALARAHWWDGTSIYRVQDNYVVQWGDRSEKKPLPAGLNPKPPEEYGRRATGLRLSRLPSPDSYARVTGFVDGWPVAGKGTMLWPAHCYGAVGVGRDLAPDAGTGAELYAVIGPARALDRNIALVGRVIEGMDILASLMRGTEALGMYAPDQTPTSILSVRLASELPAAERPAFEVMDSNSKWFGDYARLRANRNDDFFKVGHGGVDICSLPVPVRRKAAK